jgi:hypothetical protein
MTSNRPQTAVISTPQSKTNPDELKVEEIPLPPSDMWEELDNSGKPKAEPDPAVTKGTEPAAQRAQADRPIAALKFLKPMNHTVPLDFPFELPDVGAVEVVTVKRLTVGQMGDILDRRDPKSPDMFDIYAIMTGLEADVLRGLEAKDGERVTGVCFDFLPPLLRPVPRD